MPVPFTVVFAAEAVAEVTKITIWWHKHRLAAPTLFQEELRQSLLKVAMYPEIGTTVLVPGGASTRALVLRRSGYVVFYDIDADASVIEVLRVRHGKRRPLAKLKRR